MNFFQRNTATIIYLGAVAVAFGILLYGQRNISADQQAGCERGNVIRQQINAIEGALSSFLITAAQTREKTAALEEKQGENLRARADRDAAALYRSYLIPLAKLALADCT